MKIIAFHLYNDFSGSPRVLEQILSGLASKYTNIHIYLYTSSGLGALSSLSKNSNITIKSFSYTFTQNKYLTTLKFIYAQLFMFFCSFRYLFQKDVTFYVNTLLPFMPAIAAKIMGKSLVYHYHENALIKGKFYLILCRLMERIANKIICVSNNQSLTLKRRKNVYTVYNAVAPNSLTYNKFEVNHRFKAKNVLMISSLKLYKGISEFLQLAKEMPNYNFTLVINERQEKINQFFGCYQLSVPFNVKIYPRQKNVYPFYNNASILLNLSDKTKFVETFGLTALEALSCGIPVIVPTVGGIAEIVEDNKTGFKIDVQHLDLIERKIAYLLSDEFKYIIFSEQAKLYSKKFNIENVIADIYNIITK